MTASDHLNGQQFMDVYHSTNSFNAARIDESRSFTSPLAHVSNTSDSDFMDVFGPARVHLRMPKDVVLSHRDPDEAQDRAQGYAPMGRHERHYAIPSHLVEPQHIVGVSGRDN